MKTLATLLLLAAACCFAQRPKIGLIDFYGVQKVPIEKLRKALGAKEGDPLPAGKADAEQRLNEVPGVVAASLQASSRRTETSGRSGSWPVRTICPLVERISLRRRGRWTAIAAAPESG